SKKDSMFDLDVYRRAGGERFDGHPAQVGGGSAGGCGWPRQHVCSGTVVGKSAGSAAADAGGTCVSLLWDGLAGVRALRHCDRVHRGGAEAGAESLVV